MKPRFKLALLLSLCLSLFPLFPVRAGRLDAWLFWKAAQLSAQAQQWAYQKYLNNVWGIPGSPTGFWENAAFQTGIIAGQTAATMGVGGAVGEIGGVGADVAANAAGGFSRGAAEVMTGELQPFGRFAPAYLGERVGAVQFTGNVLGRGSAGTVFEGFKDGSRVAVKVSTHPMEFGGGGMVPMAEKAAEAAVQEEAANLQLLAREGLGGVRFHGTVEVGGRTGLITNVVEGPHYYGGVEELSAEA